MISDHLKNCLLRQGFTYRGAYGDHAHIFQRPEQDRLLSVVLIESRNGMRADTGALQAMDSEFRRLFRAGDRLVYGDPLFLVLSDDPAEDAKLARIPGTAVWLADVYNRNLMIYEDQPADYYGLRASLENALLGNEDEPAQGIERENGKPFTLKTFPWVTAVLIAANVAYFIILAVKGDPLDGEFMFQMGASYAPAVMEGHEYWRLFTAMFMHFGIAHLLSNMLYLVLVGYRIETTQGHVRFLLLYLLSGLIASLVSVLFYWFTKADAVCAGASGAVYGLIGAMLVLTIRNRDRNAIRRNIPRFAFLIMFIVWSSTASEGVDAAAHIGGLASGALLSFILLRTDRQIAEKKRKY